MNMYLSGNGCGTLVSADEKIVLLTKERDQLRTELQIACQDRDALVMAMTQLHISIGEGAEVTDEVLKRIIQLEDLINPPIPTPIVTDFRCHCNQPDCWDCAARRGGCMEDV
jgi:hypothetical protein